eukprot:3790463-Rhodomonas_salina.3
MLLPARTRDQIISIISNRTYRQHQQTSQTLSHRMLYTIVDHPVAELTLRRTGSAFPPRAAEPMSAPENNACAAIA